MNEPEVYFLPQEGRGNTKVFRLTGPNESIKLKIARQGNDVQYRGTGVYELNGQGIDWKRDRKYELKDYLRIALAQVFQ